MITLSPGAKSRLSVSPPTVEGQPAKAGFFIWKHELSPELKQQCLAVLQASRNLALLEAYVSSG